MRTPTGTVLDTQNSITRKTYGIQNLQAAVDAQHGNLTAGNIALAVDEALSLWSAYIPIRFVRAGPTMVSVDFPINFRRFGESDATLGNGLGDINIDQDFYVDPFTASDPHPVRPGPYDFVHTLAHEFGHQLGLDHAPDGEPAMMAPSQGNAVQRQLYPFDITNVQQRHGRLRLAAVTAADLRQARVRSTPGVTFDNQGPAAIVGGGDGARCQLDATVEITGKILNSVRVDFTLISRNVFVDTMELWDGPTRLQKYSLAAQAYDNSGFAGRQFELRFGVLARPKLNGPLGVRLNLRFKEIDAGVNGVMQLSLIEADQIAPDMVNAPQV